LRIAAVLGCRVSRRRARLRGQAASTAAGRDVEGSAGGGAGRAESGDDRAAGGAGDEGGVCPAGGAGDEGGVWPAGGAGAGTAAGLEGAAAAVAAGTAVPLPAHRLNRSRAPTRITCALGAHRMSASARNRVLSASRRRSTPNARA